MSLQKLFSLKTLPIIVVFLMPFLRYYDVPGTNIGSQMVLLILLFALLFLNSVSSFKKLSVSDGNTKKSLIFFVLFALWSALLTIYFELFTRLNANNSSSYTIFALISAFVAVLVIVLLFFGKLDHNVAFKIYSFFVFLVVAIYILQWAFVAFGIKVSFKMPFHKYSSAWEALDGSTFGMENSPTSLFSERAHMCQFLLPYVVLTLFNNKTTSRRKDMLRAIFVSAIIVSTISGNGVVCVGLIWVFFFVIFLVKNNNINKRNKAFFLLGMAALVCLFLVLMNTEPFRDMFSHLFSDTSGSSYHYSKAEYRIYRGFDYYSQMPIIYKALGVGFKHMDAFSNVYGIHSTYDNTNEATFEYFSTLFQILLYFGAVGFLFVGFHFYYLLRTKILSVAGMVILLVALWISSQMLFDEFHIIYILIISSCLYTQIKKPIVFRRALKYA